METIRKKALKISPRDNVAVALVPLAAGSVVTIEGEEYPVLEDIPFGHKLALQKLATNQDIIKYGYPIGHATCKIAAGQWVHSHNLKTNLDGKIDYCYEATGGISAQNETSLECFEGYLRADGRVGIRNEIWIIPTVSCVNHTAKQIAELAQQQYGHLCDGVFAFPHNAGCSQLGEDEKMTQRILAGLVRHPNAGGVLLLGLGCENNHIAAFSKVLGSVDSTRVRTLVAQDVEDELVAGVGIVGEIAQILSQEKREPVSASKLVIGFKCGGSDAFSGITANPLCGQIANRIAAVGGCGILTEVPEMFGAETILMNRAKDEATFLQVVEMINSFKQYYIDHKQPIYENPSPGNKDGGITTMEEKSLGCIQKGGEAQVCGTLDYGESCTRPGLSLLIGPGNDSVSITNLIASGAQILLFTTGRGNPLGTAVPTVKIASNSQLNSRKPQWIDFNAGDLLTDTSMEGLSESLWGQILHIASGKKAKNEKNGYREIMIFKNGVTL